MRGKLTAVAVCTIGVAITGCVRGPDHPRAVPAPVMLEQSRDSEVDPYDATFLERIEAAGLTFDDPGVTAFNARAAVCQNLHNGYARERIEADLRAGQHGWSPSQVELFVDVAMSTYPDCRPPR